MLVGQAAIIQGDVNKLEKLDDRSIMKFKKAKAKSCTCEIVTPHNSTNWRLASWKSALYKRTWRSWWI